MRNHFIENDISAKFNEECAVFNKTFIHTKQTNQLNEVKQICGESLFNETLNYSAEEIARISNKGKLPILIFGKTLLTYGKLFECFWSTLNLNVSNTRMILVFNHPSRNHFTNEWKLHESILKYKNTKDLLFQIGTLNADKIRTTYK